MKNQSIELPRDGWTEIDADAIRAVVLRLSASDPTVTTPPACRGWKAPGNAEVGFILVQVPGYCPRLFLDNYNAAELVPLPHNAAHAALSYVLGEKSEHGPDTTVSQILYELPATGWEEADPTMIRAMAEKLGTFIPPNVKGYQCSVPGHEEADFFLLSVPGRPPFCMLITDTLAMPIPADAALMAEKYATGGGGAPVQRAQRDLRGRRSIDA